ncbi:MAG: AAA domain-containing protein [Phycisphaera sp.]|nr:MAG: AAA domain-containing protein [Phycisphaera sp.]
MRFLREITELSIKSVRDTQSYEHCVWLQDIAGAPGCVCRVPGELWTHGDEFWAEVVNQRKPPAPLPPEVCERWIKGVWDDYEQEPTLRDRVLVPAEAQPETDAIREDAAEITQWEEPTKLFASPAVSKDGASDANAHELALADHPDVAEAWQAYLEQQWRPWVDRIQTWLHNRRIYRKFFEIHQAQERLGEAYELVMGFGLLAWAPESGEPVRRHLLCANVELELDPNKGVFTLRPASEGVKLRVELDMVPVDQRPTDLQERMSGAALIADDDPWELGPIENALRSAARALHQDGEYERAMERPGQANAAPRVHIAPALILRKRSTRDLLKVLDAISLDVEEAGALTPLLQLAVEATVDAPENDDHERSPVVDLPEPVYMPLPTNDDQEAIVHKARHAHGVLVQGPPGTGKSHTIANLICHLLATGQRVLVTAQTPRALQVLVGDGEKGGKLPEAIRPLCVGLMGRGRDEMRSLGECVGRILGKREEWTEAHSAKTIAKLKQTLDGLRAQQAGLASDLRQLRERETYQHSFGDGAYKGTLARITRDIEADAARLGWFEDEPEEDASFDPIVRDDLGEFLGLLRSISADDERELAQSYPRRHDLPSPQDFASLAGRERDAKSEAAHWSEPGRWGEALRRTPRDSVEIVATTSQALRAKIEQATARQLPWSDRAVREVLGEHETPWRELLDGSARLIDGLRARARDADEKQVHGAPESLDAEAMRFEATRLVEHLEAGGRLGWSPFKRRPKAVRNAAKLIRPVRIAGRPCEDAAGLRLLIERTETELAVRRLCRLWAGKAHAEHPLLADRVAEIEEHNEVLAAILEAFELLGPSQQGALAAGVSPMPAWSDPQTAAELAASAQYALSRLDLSSLEEQWRATARALPREGDANAHPINTELRRIIEQRDAHGFAAMCPSLEDLWKRSADLARRKSLERGLSEVLPRLVDTAHAQPDDDRWPERLADLDKAWAWACSRQAVRALLEQDDSEELERRYKDTGRRIEQAVENLAAEKAWLSCFTTMNDAHASHLKGWKHAVQKVGKGTGKHAEKYRRDAQRHLEACREAIPAWVMPLHRLYESIQPKAGMFDVAIVDEASQCAQDALVLAYLAKRVIVVGDDQQISPSAGFMDGDVVEMLIRKHLDFLVHKDLFRKGNSLYDAANRWFGNSIVLKEHFRCVPEIIRFSNDLCYSASPLIPLRQDRPSLEPLVCRRVPEGHREGRGQRVVNKPEAVALADAIAECCNDPRYRGKTMGVITLQGSGQAPMIENLLLDRLGPEEIEKRRILCGDAYAFQGDERHVMFLSMVAAPNERIGALTKEDDKRRFNVAASRAQDQMWLFHTATPNDLNPNCVRRRLLDFFQDPRGTFERSTGVSVEQLDRAAVKGDRYPGSQPHPFDSWFEVDVALRIANTGYSVTPQYELARYQIDLVIEGEVDGKLRRLAVECDGDHWHGPEQYAQDVHRQRQLERAGMRFCRIRESAFYANQEKAMEQVWQAVSDLGIGKSL